MPYLSEIIGKTVADVTGERIGTLEDIVVSIPNGMPHPVVKAIVVKRGKHSLTITYSDVIVLIAPAIPLSKSLKEIVEYPTNDKDVFLARDVLDQQIIDTNGVRVVRVNDIELGLVGGQFYVVNVDIGNLGLIRRLGLGKFTKKITARTGNSLPDNTISWDNIELLSSNQTMRLKVPGDKISELHPADLAEIISDLNRSQSGDFLDSLTVEALADTLEEVEPEFQASLVKNMSDEKVANVLEEMAPDEAADLLAELPKDRSEDLLDLMEDEEAEDVRKLLAFPEDTAGGIMTTEYISVHPAMTAEEAISHLRETAQDAETIFYVYVTDEVNRLVGVFSLSDLILANPKTPLPEFMHKKVIRVNLLDQQDDIAQIIAKYNLLAVPVVDDNNCLHGIVTSDDALDKIIPTAWKKRLPRLYH